MNVIQAQLDARLRATLGLMRPLILAKSEPGLDLPGYVRAGSAVRRWGQRTVVIQDDVHALALLDEHSGELASLPLPVGADGRRSFSAATGNKARDGVQPINATVSRFGIIAGDEVRMTEILGADAAPSRLKLEGIDWRGGQGEQHEFVVVADMDDPDSPALIGTLVVSQAV